MKSPAFNNYARAWNFWASDGVNIVRKTMHLRRRLLYAGLAAALLFDLTLFVSRRTPYTARGYSVRISSDTCSCQPLVEHPYVHLSADGSLTIGPRAAIHVSESGDMTVGTLSVQPAQAVTMLSLMYSLRPERILYISADDDVRFQAVADMLDRTHRLEYPPSTPTQPNREVMNVEVRLVTRGAVNAPCPTNCFNWVKQPLTVH